MTISLLKLPGVLLNETVPSWVVDIAVEKKLPKFIRVTFFVLPHPSLGYKAFKRERLIANDFLQEHRINLDVSNVDYLWY